MASKIFYIDPANGSNDNDGSAPDKAWADATPALSSDDSTADEPALLYVRRSGDQTFADDIDWSDNPNRIIIGWPNEGEPYYDVRPQDGQDAGWDEGVVDQPKIIINKGVNTKSTTPSVLGFYNMNLETSNDNTDLAIQYSIGNVNFENCVINHQRNDDGDSFLSFHRIDDTSGSSVISIKNCDVSFDGMLFGCRDDVDWPEVDFTFNTENNSYIATDNGYAIWYWRASQTNQNITSNNDSVNAKDKGSRFVYEDEDNNNFAKTKVNINNLHYIGSHFMYGRRANKLTLNINNSNISLNTSGNGVIVWVHHGNKDSKYKTDITLNNSTIEGKRIVYLPNSNGDHSAIGDLIITNCSLNTTMDTIYIPNHIDMYAKKLIINNCEVNTYKLIQVDNYGVDFGNTVFNIKNSNITYSSFCGIRNVSFTAVNSSIQKLAENGDANSHNQITLIDSEVANGSSHVDYIKANGSKLSGDFQYSKIEAYNCEINFAPYMPGIFRNCKTSDYPATVHAEMELFSCVVNDEPTPYAKISPKLRIETSNVFRVNGDNGSLKIYNKSGLEIFNLDRLVYQKTANKNKLTFFIASQTDNASKFNYTLSINYVVDGTSYIYTSNPISLIKSNQEWSGLYEGYKSYEATFDIPSHDTDLQMEVSLIGTHSTDMNSKITSPIYIDLKTLLG